MLRVYSGGRKGVPEGPPFARDVLSFLPPGVHSPPVRGEASAKPPQSLQVKCPLVHSAARRGRQPAIAGWRHYTPPAQPAVVLRGGHQLRRSRHEARARSKCFRYEEMPRFQYA